MSNITTEDAKVFYKVLDAIAGRSLNRHCVVTLDHDAVLRFNNDQRLALMVRSAEQSSSEYLEELATEIQNCINEITPEQVPQNWKFEKHSL